MADTSKPCTKCKGSGVVMVAAEFLNAIQPVHQFTPDEYPCPKCRPAEHRVAVQRQERTDGE